MKNTLTLFLFFFYLSSAYSQQRPTLSIQQTEIKDTVLVSRIHQMIERWINNPQDNRFKNGLGYIKVHQLAGGQKDTLTKYYLTPDYFFIYPKAANTVYPQFYTFIDNRLVTIYIDALKPMLNLEYSERSKKRFRKLIDNYVEKPQTKTFYDENEKKVFTDKNFRINYLILHEGEYLYVIKNKPPLVLKE